MAHNVTVAVPERTTVYYNPSEICTPIQWLDIIIFLLTNYLAHIATVRIPPGEKGKYSAFTYVLCFFFPLVGLQMALGCIFNAAIFAKTPLLKAARAGALIMIVPSKERSDGPLMEWLHGFESCYDLALPSSFKLNEDYGYRFVPENAHIIELNLKSTSHRDENSRDHLKHFSRAHVRDYSRSPSRDPSRDSSKDRSRDVSRDRLLPSNYGRSNLSTQIKKRNYEKFEVRYRWNLFKIMISVLQLLYSLYSLYKVTNHELERFGFAAYGLTTASYAIMGIFNLIANMVTPEFDQLYLVKSKYWRLALDHSDYVSSSHSFPIVGKIQEDGPTYRDPDPDAVELEAGVQPKHSSNPTKALPFDKMSYLKSNHPLLGYFTGTASTKMRRYSEPDHIRPLLITISSALVVGGIFTLIYFLSKLRFGQSTLPERVWITGWLVTGSIVPFIVQFNEFLRKFFHELNLVFLIVFVVFLLLPACAFPIGGLVVVIQEMQSFGSCTSLS